MNNRHKKNTNTLSTIFVALFVFFSANLIFSQTYATEESFEGQGWNARNPRGFTPGLKSSLSKEFVFNQLQGNHSFVIEDDIVRTGNYSAKLVWKHDNPAQYNDNVNVVDNVDRKAMFHGNKTSTVKGADAWYGFSVYFPEAGTREEINPWLFFQIHASADRSSGEPGRNPPFFIRFGEDGFTGAWKWDAARLSVGRETQGETPYRIPVNKEDYLDRWVDFVLHVRFDYSNDRDGIVELWIDEEKVLNERNIRVGYNDEKGLYPSWGMYWNSDLSVMRHDHFLYMDELRNINGNATYNDVAPKGDIPTGNQPPNVSITSPGNDATFEVGEEITLRVSASDPDGNLDRVNFKINNVYYVGDGEAPYETTFTPTEAGTYKLAARAIDADGLATEVFVNVTVNEPNHPPSISISSPLDGTEYELGDEVTLTATASDVDGNLDRVNFKVNNAYYVGDGAAPYETTFIPTAAGSYKLAARAIDAEGLATEVFVTITVKEPNSAPSVSITSPMDGAEFELGQEITLTATASDVDGNFDRVNFKVNNAYYVGDGSAPYETTFTPTEAGNYKLAARAIDAEGLATEVSVSVEVRVVTGQDDLIELDGLTVFPNPSNSGMFNLNKAHEWSVFDPHGINIKSGDSSTIDLTNQSNGLYFLKVSGVVHQIILQH